jgi:hypothetical protein
MRVPGIEPLLSGSGGTIQKHGYGTQLVQFLLCLRACLARIPNVNVARECLPKTFVRV